MKEMVDMTCNPNRAVPYLTQAGDTREKWVYVEDKYGNLLAKEHCNLAYAFNVLREKGYLVSTKLHTDHFVVFRLY